MAAPVGLVSQGEEDLPRSAAGSPRSGLYSQKLPESSRRLTKRALLWSGQFSSLAAGVMKIFTNY